METFQAFEAARDAFDARLREVKSGQWKLGTPCPDWDVRALVNHVIGGNVRYVMLLHGAGLEEINASRSMDHAGDDPVAAFRHSAAELQSAFEEPGALSRRVQHPGGELSGADLLGARIIDYAAHGWDLARAIGGDERLDEELIAYLLTSTPLLERLEWGRARGYFAQPPQIPSDASAQARWLNLTGRVMDQPQKSLRET